MNSVVYLPGVWDVFHPGHLNVINRAKLCGDYLVVGVCSDRLVQLHKKIPATFNEAQRSQVIAGLKSVDEVYVYDNPDQTEAIRLFNAQMFVVGEEFGFQGVPEHQKALDYCASTGIPVVRIPRMPGVSSSDLKGRVIDNFWKSRGQKVKAGEVGLWQSTSLTSSEKDAEARKVKDFRSVAEAISRSVHRQKTVLELGCGVGRITEELAKLYERVYALDYVQDFIDIAKNTVPNENVVFVCADAVDFDRSVEYDCCVITGLFPYLGDQKAEQLVSSLCAIPRVVLKESVGTFGRYELPPDHFSDTLGEKYTAIYRSLPELIDLFGRAGFVLKYTDVVDFHRKETHLRSMLFERTS